MIRNRAYCQTVEPRGPLDLSYYADALHINPLRALLLQALKGLLLLIFGHPIFLEVCDPGSCAVVLKGLVFLSAVLVGRLLALAGDRVDNLMLV